MHTCRHHPGEKERILFLLDQGFRLLQCQVCRFLVAHEGGLRRQQVTSNVQGRDIASFVTEVERKLRDVPMPEGVFYALTGEHEARATAQRELFFIGR